MVVDLKKVTLGQDLADGTLWVVEQNPGLVVGEDQTTILRAGLFCVYFAKHHHVYIVHCTVCVGCRV